MKAVLLIGVGKFGLAVTKKLSELKQQIMIVDKDEAHLNLAMEYATNAQIGDSTDEEFLRSLSPHNFDVCIVAIGRDFQSSLETASLLKELGAPKVVARASTEIHAKFLLRNGADEVVEPNQQIAEWLAIRHTSEHVLDFVDMDSEYSIFEFRTPSKWIARTLAQLDVRRNYQMNVIGVRSDSKLNMAISGDTVLHEGESIMAVATKEVMRKLSK